MTRTLLTGLLLAALFCAGCASDLVTASQQLAKVKQGMTPAQVRTALGPPRKVLRLTLKGHQHPYLVYEYLMLADDCECVQDKPMQAVARVLTFGASDQQLVAEESRPYWLYFLKGRLFFKGRALKCAKGRCLAQPLSFGKGRR